MRLPWRRARACPPAEPERPRPGMDAALAAVNDARAAVGAAESRGPQVAELVDRLRSLRQENHISDRFEQAVRDGYRGGGGHADGD
jgi:hypothetical protein